MDWPEATIDAVWQTARRVDRSAEARGVRKDLCGVWSRRADYGDATSPFGWEIDHIIPRADGGGSSLYNLQPLQWENRRAKRSGAPGAVTADGSLNVSIERLRAG